MAERFLANLAGDKPHSAVTDWIERLCSERYAKDDYDGIVDLIKSIELQYTGPAEASRAIRKKLKYGNIHRQTRALVILKALVENCGPTFQTTFGNERLLERIKIMAGDPHVDESVRRTLFSVLISWRNQFKDDPRMSLVAGLYDQLKPNRAGGAGSDQAYRERQQRGEAEERALREAREKERMAREQERIARIQAEEDARRREKEQRKRMKEQARFGGSGQQGGQQQRRVFNFEEAKPRILAAVGEATQACNGLVNALQRVNRESESVTTNLNVQEYLMKVKDTRKRVVRYTQLIEDDPSGDFIGTLISTNEQIIAALSLYDRWSQTTGDDSDDEAVDAQTVAAATNNRQPVRPDLAAKLSRMSVHEDSELEKLQDRQKAEVDRLNKQRSGTTPGLHTADLLDLDFSGGAQKSASLPNPMQPRHHKATEDRQSDTLSMYSDYSSSDEEHHAPTSSTSQGRGYSQYLSEQEKKQVGKSSALADQEEDPFADPDDSDGASTPGLRGRREFAEV